MKTNKNTLIIVLNCLLFILYSCSGNNIYFDIKSQSLKTCNKQSISNLHIIGEDNKDFYHFSILSDKKGTNTFSLININHNYTLEDMSNVISIDSFRLKPETGYRISNSTFGDAAESEILIKTDKEGKVIYADVTSCK